MYQQSFPPAAPVKKRGRAKAILIAVGLLALVGVSYAMGAAGSGSTPVSTAVQVEEAPEVRTVTKTVERAPQACLDALEKGDVLASQLEWAIDWSIDALTAASQFDIDMMDELTAEMNANAEKPEVQGVLPSYKELASKCRAETL